MHGTDIAQTHNAGESAGTLYGNMILENKIASQCIP